MSAQLHGPLRHVLRDQVRTLTRKIERDHGKPYEIAQHKLGAPATVNAALLLNRLWLGADNDEVQTALRVAQLREVARACQQVGTDLLDALHARRRAAAAALAARHDGWAWQAVPIEPMWRLVVGHGEDSAHETSLTLSPTYGLPVLPGTALKGLAVAAARETGWSELDTTIFGAPRPAQPTEAERGSVRIWDALPATSPQLVLDVLTPHTKDYYDAGNAGHTPTAQPAEYHNPVPVRFLAVENTSFRGYLAGPASDLPRCRELIKQGLAELGIGGKTAAGYGYCTVPEEVPA